MLIVGEGEGGLSGDRKKRAVPEDSAGQVEKMGKRSKGSLNHLLRREITREEKRGHLTTFDSWLHTIGNQEEGTFETAEWVIGKCSEDQQHKRN